MARFILLVCLLAPCMGFSQEADLREVLPLWDRAFTVRHTAGYNDNVLLSRDQLQRSAFLAAGLDAVVWRIPADGYEFQFLGSGDYRRYLGASQAADEHLYLGEAEFKKALGADWLAAFKAGITHQDRIATATSLDLPVSRGLQIEGRAYQVTPALRRELGTFGWVELSIPGARFEFGEVLDSFWSVGPKLQLARSYARQSEWRIGYAWNGRRYDNRLASFADGTDLIPRRPLQQRQHTVEFSWLHYWDAALRFSTTARMFHRFVEDNGVGYLDYRQPGASIAARYKSRAWEIAMEAEAAHYDYAVQRARRRDGNVTSAPLRLTLAGVRLRLERRLTSWLDAFAEFEHQQSLSNQFLDNYSANTVSGGVAWEF